MDAQQLIDLQRVSAFKPFYLVMKDGRSLPVSRRFCLAVSPTGQKLVYAKPTGGFDVLAIEDVAKAVVDEQIRPIWRRSG
jgi:hypothetical protein